MNWKGRIAMTGEMIDRIVALLLAIADLAERAAGVPDARRSLVLAIIRRAETAACDLAGASTNGFANRQRVPSRPIAAGDGPEDTPEDAMALAMSLRALALMLRSMTGRARRLARLLIGEVGEQIGDCLLRHRRHGTTRRLPDTPFPPALRLDTS